MKRILLTLYFSVTLATLAQAKLNVVTTLPDFGSIAKEIGGDKVDVTVMAKPTEDPHFVDARPSFVVQLRDADDRRRGRAGTRLVTAASAKRT